jgi:hypothetical protein
LFLEFEVFVFFFALLTSALFIVMKRRFRVTNICEFGSFPGKTRPMEFNGKMLGQNFGSLTDLTRRKAAYRSTTRAIGVPFALSKQSKLVHVLFSLPKDFDRNLDRS